MLSRTIPGRLLKGRRALSRLLAILWLVMLAASGAAPAAAQPVVVGGKGFTEQLLMTELTSQLLQARGYQAQPRTGLSSPGIRRELEAGIIDLYWEYTGTAFVALNNAPGRLGPEETYRWVKEQDARRGFTWLPPSKVNNTYALAMRRAEAAAKGISSISHLAARVRQGERLKFACNTEFYIRADGLLPLQRAYGFEFARENVVRTTANTIYDLLRERADINVGLVFSTDANIAADDLVLLEDDRNFFPSYLLTPVVRQRTLDKHPDLARHLEALAAQLDNATIASLNAMIDVQSRPVEEVATGFLRQKGLI